MFHLKNKGDWIILFDRIQEYALYALIFFLPIGKALIEVFFGIAFFGFFVKKILKPDFKFLKSPPNLFLLLFFIFSALSMFNSGIHLAKSADALFTKWFEYIWIFLLMQDSFSIDEKRARNALVIFVAMSAVVGLDGLSQKFLGVEFLRGRPMMQIKEGIMAIRVAFNHYNSFGAYLVVMLPIVMVILVAGRINKQLRIGLFFLAVILGFCLLFTFSRGSWLGFLTAGFFFLILSRNFKVIIPVAIIFLISLLSIPQLRERFLFTFQAGGDATRLAIWQGTVNMIKENPFLGKGVGTFMDYFPKYVPNMGAQYAHNSYLQIWAESGAFALLAFLAFWGALLTQGIRKFFKNDDAVLLGVICAIIGLLAHSFFDNQFYSLQLSALLWSMAGILSALSQRKKDNIERKVKTHG